MTDISLEDTIAEAKRIVADLITKYGITDVDHAKRLIRERFTDDELLLWKRALQALDGNGALD